MQKRPIVEPTTQSQPARPPSAGMADLLLGSLTAVERGSGLSSLGSMLEDEDGDMSVVISSSFVILD